MSKSSGEKHTAMFSNVPGYVKPVYYLGGLTRRFFYAGVGTGNIATSIVMVSMMKRFQITITSDSTQVKEPEVLLELFTKELEKLDLMYKESEEGKE